MKTFTKFLDQFRESPKTLTQHEDERREKQSTGAYAQAVAYHENSPKTSTEKEIDRAKSEPTGAYNKAVAQHEQSFKPASQLASERIQRMSKYSKG